MKTYTSVVRVVAALTMSLFLIGISGIGMSGCKAGPAERAGKKIDKTVEKGGEQVEKAGKKMQEDMKR